MRYSKHYFIYGIISFLCYYQLTIVFTNLIILIPAFKNELVQLSLLTLSYILPFIIIYVLIKRILISKINSRYKYIILILIFVLLVIITIFIKTQSIIIFTSKLNTQEIANYQFNESIVKFAFTVIWLFILGYVIFKEDKQKFS
jgi:membrane protease YdiL (CAAX protease family)